MWVSCIFALLMLVVTWRHSLLGAVGASVPSGDFFTISGNSMLGNCVMGIPPRRWVGLPALFNHFGTDHVINNAYMVMIFGSVVESAIGPFATIAVFAVCGYAGWIASVYFIAHAFPSAWVQGVAQFTECAGASPALYGLAMVGSIVTSGSTTPNFVSPFGVPLSFHVATLLVLTSALQDGGGASFYGFRLAMPLRLTGYLVIHAGLWALLDYAMAAGSVYNPASVAVGFAAYSVYHPFTTVVRRWGLKGTVSGADHASHAAGAAAGVVVGTIASLWWGMGEFHAWGPWVLFCLAIETGEILRTRRMCMRMHVAGGT